MAETRHPTSVLGRIPQRSHWHLPPAAFRVESWSSRPTARIVRVVDFQRYMTYVSLGNHGPRNQARTECCLVTFMED